MCPRFQLDLYSEQCSHREAEIEFGEDIAKRLKLSADGTKVLWPQPTDDSEDPQNVGLRRFMLNIR